MKWCYKVAEVHNASLELSEDDYFAKRRKLDEEAQKEKFKFDMEIIGRHMGENFEHYAEIIERHEVFKKAQKEAKKREEEEAKKNEDEKGEDEAKASSA